MPKEGIHGQCSAPTEQEQPAGYGNGDSFYQTSEGNVYTHSQNSLVLSDNGRTVCSNPGSPNSVVLNALSHAMRSPSYSDAQLPLAINTDATLVIPDENHSAYCNAFTNSNVAMTLVMSPEGESSGIFDDDLPNEACNTRNSNLERLHAKMSNQFPVNPLAGSDIYFQHYNESPGMDFSSGAQYDSVDMASGQCNEGGASSMVTGIGATGGGGGGGVGEQYFHPIDMFPLQNNQKTVFEDDNFLEDQLRLLDTELLYSMDPGYSPEMDFLKTFDATSDNFLSSPVDADFFNTFCAINTQPVQAQLQIGTASQIQNGESIQEQSETEYNLDMIKMMKVPIKKPSAPSNLGLQGSNHMVPVAPIPSPFSGNTVSPSSSLPSTPYVTQPCAPVTPIQAVPPSPAPPNTPHTPATPCSSQNGPFEVKSYIDRKCGHRVCEVGVHEDLQPDDHRRAIQANYFSWETCLKYIECLGHPYDLKVAIDARAELCRSNIDHETARLQFTMPQDCMHLDKWLHVNQGKIDLRDRQLVLQQIINLLAAIHTTGSNDKLSLWGSFVVWVAPDKRVYILIDFPEMLSKIIKHGSDLSYDSRIEDVRCVYELYNKIFKPFINQDSSWVSPGVKQLLESFEALVVHPSSVYRMAELARTLGERRLCKLEVELMTLPHYVYCIEHEPLKTVLSHITSMVPPVNCHGWEVLWMESGKTVRSNVVASAHRKMRLQISPAHFTPSAGGDQGLTFQSS